MLFLAVKIGLVPQDMSRLLSFCFAPQKNNDLKRKMNENDNDNVSHGVFGSQSWLNLLRLVIYTDCPFALHHHDKFLC